MAGEQEWGLLPVQCLRNFRIVCWSNARQGPDRQSLGNNKPFFGSESFWHPQTVKGGVAVGAGSPWPLFSVARKQRG